MARLSAEDTSRRQVLRAGLAVVGGLIAATAAADDNRADGQTPLPKFTPEEVHYQGTPHDWQKCIFCAYFKEPSTCGILSAPVSRNGWCEKFLLLHE
jgi:hypothetical protein